jgi:predicted aconitase
MDKYLKSEVIHTLEMAETQIDFLTNLVKKHLAVDVVSSVNPLKMIRETKQKVGEA